MKVLGDGEKRLTNGFGILEDLGDIPLDEIMAIGVGLSAAAATAILMIEAFNRVNMTQDEKIRKLEADNERSKAMIDGMATLLDVTLSGTANITKEALVGGSVLPDKVG